VRKKVRKKKVEKERKEESVGREGERDRKA
jgi:hypothetical protein